MYYWILLVSKSLLNSASVQDILGVNTNEPTSGSGSWSPTPTMPGTHVPPYVLPSGND